MQEFVQEIEKDIPRPKGVASKHPELALGIVANLYHFGLRKIYQELDKRQWPEQQKLGYLYTVQEVFKRSLVDLVKKVGGDLEYA